jgi:hypothetical protein
MTTIPTLNYRLQVRQCNPSDSAQGYQLVLLQVEENRQVFMWIDATVAACKTKAANIFANATSGQVATSPSNATLEASTGLVWVGDVSDGTNNLPNGSDLIWADAALVY